MKPRDDKDATDRVTGAVTSKWAKGTGGPSGDEAQNLVAVQPDVVEPTPLQDTREVEKKQNGLGVGKPGDPSFTLDTTSRAGVGHANVEPTYSLQGSLEGRSDTAGPGGRGWKEDESFTLNTADRHSVAGASYGVRRLTPVECERLQAFPDGWTEPAGSDSARYKALGNAVTVNTVWWSLRRMKAQG